MSNEVGLAVNIVSRVWGMLDGEFGVMVSIVMVSSLEV
jgi:hypothetical protein